MLLLTDCVDIFAGIAEPGPNAHGTWHNEYARNNYRILIFQNDEVDQIRSRIQSGEDIFGVLYSNNLSGRRGTKKGLYERALEDPATLNRIQKAFAVKNQAFVYLMGLDDSLQPFDQPADHDFFKDQAINQLRTFDNSAWEPNVSRPNPDYLSELIWKGQQDDYLYDLQNRSKELICYLQAYEMLRPEGHTGIWEEDIARRLIQFASNIYFMADIFSSEFSRNNHRILVGSALGMVAVLFGEWGSEGSSETSRDGRSYMPKYWIGYAMSNINSVLFEGIDHQVFSDGGYNEGPHYLRYGMALALPFFKAHKNFGEIFGLSSNGEPAGDWIETYWTRPETQYSSDIRSPWFGRKGNDTPDIHDVLDWMAKIRQPEGRLPALADTHYDSYFPETAIKGEHYLWPIASFDPSSSPSYIINWWLSDFMESRVDYIAAGNFPQESPAEWENLQIFSETGDIVMRGGWGLEDIYFHMYAKDYVYGTSDYALVSHLHHDNSSFIIGYKKQVLALDCGYIRFSRREEVEGSENHNLILVNLSGPSKYNDKAQIQQSWSNEFYDFVKVNTDYQSTNIKRNTLFCNGKYFIINDQINGSRSNSYLFVLHGNDPAAQEIPNGAVWQIEDAKLKSKVASQLQGPNLATSYYVHYHDDGYNRTSEHKVLKVQKSTDDTQFLSVHFPYSANLSPDPEIEDVSTSAYAGLFVDRTFHAEYGNRYEFVISQWPTGNVLSIPEAQYGSSNKTIADIETDAEFAVLSFDPSSTEDPNTINLFGSGMTYFNYGNYILYPNHPPQLVTITNQTMQEGDTIEVPISAQDPNGDIISFSVNNLPSFGSLIDNGDGTAIIRFSPGYFDAGIYSDIEVIAGDDEIPQLTDQKTFSLDVQNINLEPVADASSDIDIGLPPMAINFDASGSYDSDGAIVSYNWDFGDGTSSDLANPQHVYDTAGKYYVTLTVTDNESATAAANLIIINNADLNKIRISEVSDATPDSYAFLELYNYANYDVNLSEFKLIQQIGFQLEDMSYEYVTEYIYDLGIDESRSGSSTTIPSNDVLVLGRGITQTEFESEWNILPSGAAYNSGTADLRFHLGRRYQLHYFDGTIDNDDGSQIDDTRQLVGGQNSRSLRITEDEWWLNVTTPSTPGRLEEDQSLPVQLKLFDAQADREKITLKWVTHSELNNYGFIILRSLNRDSLFEKIASYESDLQLRGLGNSAHGKEYIYIDRDVMQFITYWYKLVDISLDGIKTEHGPIEAALRQNENNLTAIDLANLPQNFALYNNYPNPFNGSTMIQFDIPENIRKNVSIEINIYDILGRKIISIYKGILPSGRYRVQWNGTDNLGNMQPSGVYIFTMISSNYSASKKMVIVR